MMDFKYVYKICTYEEWEEAKEKGKYEGSKKDKEDGFIHFSDVEQLKGTFRKFFSKQKNLIYEQVSDGNMFPHLYEPFEISNVVTEYTIEIGESRYHNIPGEIT